MRIMRQQTDWYRDGRVWRQRWWYQYITFSCFRNMRAEWRPTKRRPLVQKHGG